jgi:hypothetical protein
LEFVTFHSDRPAHAEISHPNVDEKTVSYSRMIDLLFRSAHLFHSQIRCTVLTDKKSSIKGITSEFQRVESDIDHSALMLSRTIAQMDYLEKNAFDKPIIFIDSDILVNAPLTELFELDFDVALTWRISFKMPINGGLLILNNRRPEVAKRFFRKFCDIYRQNYADRSAWYGDQLALRDAIGMHYKDMADGLIVGIDGCKVLLLSCDTYNFSPHNEYQAINSDLRDKAILHFKGQRKRLMAPFFNVWLKPHQPLPIWQKLLVGFARRNLQKKIASEHRSIAQIGKEV